MKKTNGKFALIICGPIVSGKSTITEKISKEIKIPLISETTIGNYYKIIDYIDPFKYPCAIYEHCYIYKKWYVFQSLYLKTHTFILNPSDKIITKNYLKRKISDSAGDYLKTDPIKQRDEILSDVYNIKPQFSQRNHKLTIININHYSDYLLIRNKIILLYVKICKH
ncbi:MAG TPA: hypothetical protein PLL26_00605 [Candidatus Dojkabacteria bacterium]|nr:hypothetical protein [Candidatus Dojkabacteria bacterium]